MFFGLKKSSSALLLSLLVNTQVLATQLIEDADRDHQQATMSINEPNRLAVEGRRIAQVVPSQKGLLSVVKDERLGALYFAFAENSPNPGTVTLFVSDDQGVTYKLILVPQPIAGEEIILRPPSEKTPWASSRAHGHRGRAASYQRRIKDLIRVMADGERQDTVETIALHQKIPFGQASRLILLTQYRAPGLVGEKYRLTNTSAADLPLTEQAFYRQGVYAVAVEHPTLAVGKATDLLIVRARQDDE